MHRRHVVLGRGHAGSDRPDRLIGEHAAKPAGKTFRDLRANHRIGGARVPLGLGLAHADDRQQPGGDGGIHLGPNHRTGFMVPLPPLRVAQDHGGAPRIRQHRRRYIAGERTCRLRMAILGAEHHRAAAQRRRHDRERRERRTDHEFAVQAAGACPDSVGQHARLVPAAIHLPVAGNQLHVHLDRASPEPRRRQRRSRRGRRRRSCRQDKDRSWPLLIQTNWF
jgi:hypothetical protein